MEKSTPEKSKSEIEKYYSKQQIPFSRSKRFKMPFCRISWMGCLNGGNGTYE